MVVCDDGHRRPFRTQRRGVISHIPERAGLIRKIDQESRRAIRQEDAGVPHNRDAKVRPGVVSDEQRRDYDPLSLHPPPSVTLKRFLTASGLLPGNTDRAWGLAAR